MALKVKWKLPSEGATSIDVYWSEDSFSKNNPADVVKKITVENTATEVSIPTDKKYLIYYMVLIKSGTKVYNSGVRKCVNTGIDEDTKIPYDKDVSEHFGVLGTYKEYNIVLPIISFYNSSYLNSFIKYKYMGKTIYVGFTNTQIFSTHPYYSKQPSILELLKNNKEVKKRIINNKEYIERYPFISGYNDLRSDLEVYTSLNNKIYETGNEFTDLCLTHLRFHSNVKNKLTFKRNPNVPTIKHDFLGKVHDYYLNYADKYNVSKKNIKYYFSLMPNYSNSNKNCVNLNLHTVRLQSSSAYSNRFELNHNRYYIYYYDTKEVTFGNLTTTNASSFTIGNGNKTSNDEYTFIVFEKT